jgi:hypothetical protein
MKSRAPRIAAGLVGAFIAAIGAEAAIACGYAGILMFTSQPIGNADIGDAFIFVAASAMYSSAIIALPVILLLALPCVLVSNRLQHFSRNYYLLSGAVIGLLTFVLLEARERWLPGPLLLVDFDVRFFAISSIISGAVSAWAFWSIARPDKWQR